MLNRILCHLALFFSLGILTGVYKSLWPAAAAILCLFYIARNIAGKGSDRKKYFAAGLRMFVYALFFLAGFCRFDQLNARIQKLESGMEGKNRSEVSGEIYKKEEKNDKIIYYLRNTILRNEKRAFSCKTILIYFDTDDYPIGTTIHVTGTVREFREARNQGNFDEKSYYYSKNIWLALDATQISSAGNAKTGIREKLWFLKKRIQSVYAGAMPKKEAGILATMALGDRSLLDPEIKELYQSSGISHILAISGLHISILGAGLYGLLLKLRTNRIFSCILSSLFVYGFGLLSGMEISSRRAVIMFLLLMGGRCLGTSYDSLTALAFAMLTQLWENPFVVMNVGFLFSYGAVLSVSAAGILQDFFRRKNKKRKNRLLDTFWMSGCIQLATLPLSLYFYFEFPVYSVCINVLVLPLMGCLLTLGLAGGLAGLFHKGAARLMLKPVCWMFGWNEGVCGLAGKFPGAVYIAGRPPVWLLASYYAVFLLLLLWIIRVTEREKSEKRVKGKAGEQGGNRRPAFGRLGVFLILFVSLFGLIKLRPLPEFQMAFLDVGQGDGCFIQSKEGKNFFVDGGSSDVLKVGEFRILPFLKSRGIRQIDGWFVSHGDADHISGLLEIWESGYEVKSLILAEGMVRDESWEELISQARKYKTNVRYLAAGQEAGTESLTFSCLFPIEQGKDKNAASMVLKLEQREFTALFTGDISQEQEKQLAKGELKPIHVYKAAHHGSKTSNSQVFLEKLSPLISVVSCSQKNRYGHPSKESVERMEESGSKIFFTMESGQVTMGWNENKVWVKEWNKNVTGMK